MANATIQSGINLIETYASEAQQQGDPQIFLQRLSGENGLHNVWHYGQQSPFIPKHWYGSFGFLLFHWHLVQKVIQFFNPQALTEADFSSGGTYYSPDTDWKTFVAPNLVPAQSLDDVVVFSYNFELWHNGIHSVLSQVSGLPMGDARQNVLYPLFWQFHRFVNNVFEWQLQNYAKASGTSFSSIFQIIDFIENQPVAITNQF